MATIADPRPAGATNPDQVAAFERYIGHALPPAYRDFLLEHNGGHPVPDAFLLPGDSGEEEDVVMCFFPLRDPAIGPVEAGGMEGLRTWPLHCAWDDLRSDLENQDEVVLDPPPLPIGTDGSGSYISIVLEGDSAGAVVFLDHEMMELIPLAASFPAFLDSLRPRGREYDSRI